MKLLLALLLVLIASHARSEELVVALSQEEVAVSSNFAGTRVVLFGSIERDAQTVARPGGYDVVVVVRGPDQEVVTRRKERFLGIWINRDSREYEKVPSFYAVLSTRPLSEIAGEAALERLELGLENVALPTAEGGREQPRDNDFAAALRRLKQNASLYSADADAVERLSRSLFKAQVALPANVPLGDFTAEVFLFASGALLARETAAIRIDKDGFEQAIFALAENRPLVYGLATVLMAVFVGWLASVIFRRE